MSFLNAQAAQGVLEGLSAARPTLVHLPAEVQPGAQEPYDQPAIAIDWTRRPGYAVMAKNTVLPDRSRTVHWTDIYMGPITFQILDRAAFHSATRAAPRRAPHRRRGVFGRTAVQRRPHRRRVPPGAVIHNPARWAALIHSGRCGPPRPRPGRGRLLP